MHGGTGFRITTTTAFSPAGAQDPFVDQLFALHRLGLASPSPLIHPALRPVRTPLKIDQWTALLHQHPDPQFTDWLMGGLTEGFRIGFNHQHRLRSATSNMQETSDHPEVVSAYVQSEREQQTLLGPFDRQSMPAIHVSRFAVSSRNRISQESGALTMASPQSYALCPTCMSNWSMLSNALLIWVQMPR